MFLLELFYPKCVPVFIPPPALGTFEPLSFFFSELGAKFSSPYLKLSEILSFGGSSGILIFKF